MNAATGGSEVPVLLHQVDEQADRGRLEIDVTVKRQDVGVLGKHFLAVDGNRQLHKTVSKQVVHVHALRPAFLVPDLCLVLQVHKHLCLSGQDVEQSAAVRSGDFLWRS